MKKNKTGNLKYVGLYKIGLSEHPHSECIDCGTSYIHIKGKISCNGHTIKKCPFCRPDSFLWKNGRGI